MKLSRREFLHLAVAGAALPTLPLTAHAQAYPTRPVRWIVGYLPGGPNDVVARLIGQWLSERLGQPFIVENRPGAGTNIATEAAVKAPPDGYTLLQISASAAINATLYEKLNFNFIRDISPIAAIIRQPTILVVNPAVPATTIPEFIAYAKANPGKISMASAGVGSIPHLAGELFKTMAGIDIAHVPYRGDIPALTDLLSGQVQLYFTSPLVIEHIRAGKLRALAVTTSTRWEALPDVPTISEFLPGYETSTWFGVGAPRNTSPEIVEKLNKEVNAALTDPNIKARLTDLGDTFPGSPAEFARHIADETEKWAKVIRAANVKAE